MPKNLAFDCIILNQLFNQKMQESKTKWGRDRMDGPGQLRQGQRTLPRARESQAGWWKPEKSQRSKGSKPVKDGVREPSEIGVLRDHA